MEGWKEKKPLRQGTRLTVGRTRHRVIIRMTEPVDEIHLTLEEAFAFARALDRNAREAGPIIMPGDLGALPKINGHGRKA